MKFKTYKIKSEVWIYPGVQAAWHFASVDKKNSEEMKKTFGACARGFGSLPVLVTVGQTNWKTSIFPDRKSGTYLLPLKASMRNKEGIRAGDSITFHLKILS